MMTEEASSDDARMSASAFGFQPDGPALRERAIGP